MRPPVRVRDLTGRRVVVWGYGNEGRAAVRLLSRHCQPESLAVVVDTEPQASDLTDDVAVLFGSEAIKQLERAEVIVKSPGVSPYHGLLEGYKTSALVTGGTALWFAENGGARTIAVTGSKGKSTTSSLVAHFLNAVGIPTTLAGNVGRPLLDVLLEELEQPNETLPTTKLPTTNLPTRNAPTGHAPTGNDPTTNLPTRHERTTYALELSSFQTAEVRHSPTVGVLSALFPEHLDWHESVERYYADKCNLFAHRDGAKLVANFDNDDVVTQCQSRLAGSPTVVPYGRVGGHEVHVRGTTIFHNEVGELLDMRGANLVGRHNALNICGALTAIREYGVDLASSRNELQTAIETFLPLEHRLQPVGFHRNRLVIDDSLSTAPQAAVAALAAFSDRPVGIIVGGHDRGLDYAPLALALSQRTTPTWVLGVPLSGERIVPLIQSVVSKARNSLVTVEAFDDFDDAVIRAADVVPEGGVLLLSPAAPSFGRFANYRERGLHFRKLLGLTAPS
jgi:UDP-N-acetylmuramoyl-L-alanine---L-glutamate ligase